MHEGQRLADRRRDLQRAFEGKSMLLRLGDCFGDGAARHVLHDAERLPAFVADVVDRDEVGVSAEACQCLRLASHSLSAGLVESLGADQREGDIAVEQRVVREVDTLLPALAEEAPYSGQSSLVPPQRSVLGDVAVPPPFWRQGDPDEVLLAPRRDQLTRNVFTSVPALQGQPLLVRNSVRDGHRSFDDDVAIRLFALVDAQRRATGAKEVTMLGRVPGR